MRLRSYRFLIAAILFGLILGMPLFADHDHHDNPNLPTAWHEFAIFGKNTVYLSHLPMFHSIHDYQVIVQVTLDPNSLAKYAESSNTKLILSPTKKGSKGETLEDRLEDWKLPNYMKPGIRFNAEIHGDTETIASDATVTIEKVIHFKQFKESEATPKELPYILFGTPAEAYLAHRMVHNPDFDQILEVDVNSVTKLALKTLPDSKEVASAEYIVLGPVVRVPGSNNLPVKENQKLKWAPLKVNTTVMAVHDETDTSLRIRVRRQIRLNERVSRQF